MQYDRLRYETPYGRPRRRINYFAWTLAILLLTAFAFAAWLGSFYVFWQPERPDSYRLLKKLHRIDPPRRFELTAAPAGEFLNPKQLHDRYAAFGSAELVKLNSELARNYIRNFQQVHGLVPYVVGRFRIIDVRRLGPADVFTSGMVALAAAIDNGELLMEHVYPADARDLPLMRQTLIPGLEIKLERAHDISAVIHADRTVDGRVLITVMPLLYGTYTVTRGPGTFTLEPPLDLNLAAGWPLFKQKVDMRNCDSTNQVPAELCQYLALPRREHRRRQKINWCEWSMPSPLSRRSRSLRLFPKSKKEKRRPREKVPNWRRTRSLRRQRQRRLKLPLARRLRQQRHLCRNFLFPLPQQPARRHRLLWLRPAEMQLLQFSRS